ncbi:polysaccharide biosynthesis tyrosine autokinase [Paraburkholderia sediminicola]|uniref:polysaccharide biosynthesis tyrosine autokinase n=1 Tax=Paraburkholderia sediminicola TaxID=458836 RepID=UPI0038B84C50
MTNLKDIRLLEEKTDDDLSIGEYIAVLQNNRKLILIVTLVVTVLSVAYAIIAKPVYRANMVVQVEDSDTSAALLGDLAPLLGAKSETTAEIEILQSRLVLAQTVSKLKLYIYSKPKYFPVIGRWLARRAEDHDLANLPVGSLAKPLLGLESFAWGGEKIKVERFDVPKTYVESKFTLVSDGGDKYHLLDSDNDVVLNGVVGHEAHGRVDDGPVTFMVSALNARQNTKFNLLRYSESERIEDLQDKLVIAEQGKQSGILETTLDGTDAEETTDTLNAIADEYVYQNVQLNTAETEKTLVFLDQQLPALKKELESSEERYNNFRNRSGTVSLSEEAKLVLQQSVDANATLLELKQKRMELLQRFNPASHNVATIDSQISAAQDQVGVLSHRITALPDLEQSALRLMRDVTVNTDLYTGLLNSAQQLKVLKAGKVGNVRIVDRAVQPEKPIRPKRPLVVALGVVLGLILGTVAAFINRAIVRGVEDGDVIERATGVSIFAAIPQSEQQSALENAMRKGEEGIFALANVRPDDPTIESVRSLRTSLQFAMLNSTNNIVVVTGPSPGVGKSFIGSNLAAVLATSGKRVLLVDADMRRGHLHQFFGTPREDGLSELILGTHTVEQATRRQVLKNLDLITTGTVPPNPAELLLADRFAKLLQQLASSYDIVLVDTPPVLAVTDAAIVAKLAGTTLLALRHGQHPLPEIAEAVRRLRQGGAVLKGAIFNGIPRRVIGYGRYYGGYYTYQYGRIKK